MSNRTIIRTVITPRTITRRVGPAGADAEGGGVSAFADLTDAATANLPAVNTPLASALSGKAATSHTHVSAAITDATSAATANKLVLRNGTGGADFAGTVNLSIGVVSDLRFEDFQAAGGATFIYTGGSEVDHRTALGFSVTGGVLPISLGGTGSTTASFARTALGSGATGDALFTAATPAAARTTLGAGTTGDALFQAANLTSVRSTIERRVFVKPTDTTKNADAVLSADPYFQNIPVNAGVYRIYIEILGTSNSTAGLLSRLSHPANSRSAGYIPATFYGNAAVGVTIPATGATTALPNMNANGMRGLHGYLDYTFASSGFIAVEWAQNVSTAVNTTLHAGSYLIIEKLA